MIIVYVAAGSVIAYVIFLVVMMMRAPSELGRLIAIADAAQGVEDELVGRFKEDPVSGVATSQQTRESLHDARCRLRKALREWDGLEEVSDER